MRAVRDEGDRQSPHESRGVRVCRRITRHYARTFYFASACLPRATRANAYAVYGFCRWADNGVDDARDRDEAAFRLDQARRALDLAYSRSEASPGLLAFRRTVRLRSIPRRLFEDLLDGMEMDLDVTRYADFAALDRYCYRVAGVVGLMMTHVFGYRSERCLPNALALGTAMQLTNILRDIAEDFRMGRVYLPQDELKRFGVEESSLARGTVDDRFRDLMRFQIDRARRYYREAEAGIPWLVGDSSRLTVRVMGRLYGGILGAIERQGLDVFRQRARVTLPRKLATLAACQVETGGDAWRRFWG
ncbi:phytoene/squalene synthase family protein [Tundrisphaera lichenicola]|uniref:phytoene/squalene synthase family protein n=1 Tax=Tundrisphaera lichenicola TaxID=2029860 RepID=UPI003EBEA338